MSCIAYGKNTGSGALRMYTNQARDPGTMRNLSTAELNKNYWVCRADWRRTYVRTRYFAAKMCHCLCLQTNETAIAWRMTNESFLSESLTCDFLSISITNKNKIINKQK